VEKARVDAKDQARQQTEREVKRISLECECKVDRGTTTLSSFSLSGVEIAKKKRAESESTFATRLVCVCSVSSVADDVSKNLLKAVVGGRQETRDR
jgi:hypothetical protein